jgi:hypothetical protein
MGSFFRNNEIETFIASRWKILHTRSMNNVTTGEWRLLLRLLLSQRLEINAIESALARARILTDVEIKEIRRQAS